MYNTISTEIPAKNLTSWRGIELVKVWTGMLRSSSVYEGTSVPESQPIEWQYMINVERLFFIKSLTFYYDVLLMLLHIL